MPEKINHKYAQLITTYILVGIVPSAISAEQEKALHGSVSKKDNPASGRVQRQAPSTVYQKRINSKENMPSPRSNFNSLLERTDFQLPKTTQNEWKPQASTISGEDKLTSNRELKDAVQEKPTFTKNTPAPSSTSTTAPAATSPETPSSRKAQKQLIIIRLTYLALDEQNSFYGFKFAESLLQNHPDIEVIVLLDKEATRIANKEQNTHFIARNEKVAQKLSDVVRSFLQKGGLVVASKDWASSFGVTEANLLAGVRLYDNSDLGNLIVEANKILEY